MFTIITPTYKRSEQLKRAIVSVRKQTYANYKLIIVNDSPDDESYSAIEEMCHDDSKILYLVNEKNMGVNFTRNRALSLVHKDSWVIFLDDDDYLAEDALAHFKKLNEAHPHINWFMTNRALTNGTSLTHAPRQNKKYSYAWDYLITKQIKGDATHCICKKSIGTIQFSTTIKQGEEWFFFYQLGLTEKLFYVNHNSTLSGGYDMHQGLNFRHRPKKEQLDSLISLCKEAYSKGFYLRPTFVLYIKLRLLKLLIKP